MKSPSDILQSIIAHHGWLFLVANIVVAISVFIVILAIIFDFVLYHKHTESKKKINSWVETGTMFLYFFGFNLLMQIPSGRVKPASKEITNTMYIVGVLLMIIGCYVNVKGRFMLKENWANQVTIYKNQTLINTGVYKIVRHPLYASLIWMLSGGSFIYFNYFAFLSVLFVFIPMMYYRAMQEEKLLVSEFNEYMKYKSQVGMFFPKLFKHDKL